MIIKYIGEDGKVHYLNSYVVNNVTIAQTKGDSTEYVMSQKSVTDELNKLQKNIEDIDVSDQLKDYALKSELPNEYDDTDLRNEMVETDNEIKQSIEDLREELKTIDCGEY